MPRCYPFHRDYSGNKGEEPLWRGVSLLNVYFIPKERREWPQLERGIRTGISHGQALPITHTTSHSTGLGCSFPQHSDAFRSLQPSSTISCCCCCTCDCPFLCLLCFIGIFSQLFEYWPSLWYTANFLPFQATLFTKAASVAFSYLRTALQHWLFLISRMGWRGKYGPSTTLLRPLF